jgi:hypothetical protein
VFYFIVTILFLFYLYFILTSYSDKSHDWCYVFKSVSPSIYTWMILYYVYVPRKQRWCQWVGCHYLPT